MEKSSSNISLLNDRFMVYRFNGPELFFKHLYLLLTYTRASCVKDCKNVSWWDPKTTNTLCNIPVYALALMVVGEKGAQGVFVALFMSTFKNVGINRMFFNTLSQSSCIAYSNKARLG